MNLSKWLRFSSRHVLILVALLSVLSPALARAAFKSNLQGQEGGSTNWGGGPLHGWQELDYIPIRTLFTGGPATNQVITVDFDHSKSGGTVKGIENLTGFFTSSNVKITSGPTLSQPNTDIWRYTYTITITNALSGFVEFRGRLAAGAHFFSGSSLNLASPTLSIFKPAAQPGLPDMVVAKSGPSTAGRGQIITYVLNYTNLASTSITAIGVQISDVLPSAVSYVAGSASPGGSIVGNTLTWDLGNLSPGQRGSVSYKVLVSTNLSVTTTFANYAQILGSQNDANSANNTAVVTTTVVVIPTPVAVDDFYSMDQLATLNISAPGVLTNDFDILTNALSAILVSPPNNGSLVFNTNGSFLYTPVTNFVGIDTFSYRASNGFSNSGPALVTINVTNSCAVVVSTNITVNNDPGQCGAVVNYPPPTTTGLCTTVICTPTNGSFFPVGTTTVTCTNAGGNGGSFTVTVLDNQPPAITCPSNIVVAAGSDCTATNVNLGAPTTSDNCAVDNVVNDAPAAFAPGTNIVIWTAFDSSGNAAGCQQLVVVVDLTPPTITCPSNLVVSANAGCGATNIALGSPVTADNCGVAGVTNNAPLAFSAGTNAVTWTVTDTSGNTASCQQLVIVRDLTSPTITCPSDLLVAANSGCSATNVSLGTPVTADNCGVASVTNNTPAIFAAGTNVVTWTVTDTSGNTNSCQQRVIVHDASLPVLSCPANVIVSANAGCGATNVNLGTPVTSDNCASVTVTNNAPIFFAAGTNSVSWTATDTAGNVSTCQQLVIVQDATPPTITCPSNSVVSANAGCNATNVLLGTPIVADNCGIASTTNNAPATFTAGTNVVTWTAVDTSGNSATCQQLIIVRDQTPPTITCPATVVTAANSGCGATNVALGSPVIADNCAVAVVTNNAPSTFGGGTNVVTWTVTDTSGNTASCQQLVIVRDLTPPLITCPANIVRSTDPGHCSASNVTYAASVTDNCSTNVTVVYNPASGSSFAKGTTTVTCTATDTSSNSSSCTFTVTVNDTEQPSISCPANIEVTAAIGQSSVAVGYTPTVSDNCPGGTFVCVPISGSSFPIGVTTVTCTATDASGNTNTCTFTVSVNPPTIPGSLVATFVTSPMVLNPQTGLFEQSVRLSNQGAATVTNSRVYVLGLPSTNTLYNRSGVAVPNGSTNPAPYVQYNLPLLPGSNVVFLLEYYLPNLKPVTNHTLLAEAVASPLPPGLPPGAQQVHLQTGRDPLPLSNGRFLLEWPAIVGRTYTLQYSSNLTAWKTVVPSIVAAASAVQWFDDGPPKTETPPNQAGSRFYRVFLLP